MPGEPFEHSRGAGEHTRRPSKKIRDYRDLRVWRKARRLGELCREAAAGFPPDQNPLASIVSRLADEVAEEIATGQSQRDYPAYAEHLKRARQALHHLERRLIEAHQKAGLSAVIGDSLLARVAEIKRMVGKLMLSLELAHTRRRTSPHIT
jgi:hypothetical protein